MYVTVDQDGKNNWMMHFSKHIPCPVSWCLSVLLQYVALFCLSTSQWGSGVWGLTAGRKHLGLIMRFLSARTENPVTIQWCKPTTTQLRLVQMPPPSPTEGCSSSIQVTLHHRKKLGLYHSTGKTGRMDACMPCEEKSPEKSGKMLDRKKIDEGNHRSLNNCLI